MSRAILPNGEECEWDERLRTVGAIEVHDQPKQYEETCPLCGKPVSAKWQNGFIPEPHNELVGDEVCHAECWEKAMREHPP